MGSRALLLAALALAPLGCRHGGATLADFTAACTASANLSEPICACIAEKAKDELSNDGFAFLVATLRGDDDRVAALRGQLATTEAIAAGMFMVSGPARCAQDLATG